MSRLNLTKEQQTINNRNHRLAIRYFEWNGELPKDRGKWEYCMHHIDENLRHTDIERYIQWLGCDLVVEKFAKHSSHTNTGRRRTEEHKKAISKAQKGKPGHRKGCVVSEESRRKMSESAKRRHRESPISEETRKKLSNSVKLSWETKRRK